VNLEIINKPLQLEIFGFSGVAINEDYAAKAFELMDRMWKVVKSKQIKNKGKNIWVYEANHVVFAGVELEQEENDTGLEKKVVNLGNYAYYKHIGPYQLIKQSGQNMRNEIERRGFQKEYPYIEIYGHWMPDETKLETELLMAIKK